MTIDITKYRDGELWELLGSVAAVMEQITDRQGEVFLFWYSIFRAVEREIDKRLAVDYEK